MQRLYVLLTCVVVGSMAGICSAADPLSADVAYGDSLPGTAMIEDSSRPSEYTASPCMDCGDCGPRCGGCRSGHMKRKAQIGYFNCNCRGSYKFPVPPQYTYFWPGMYSQQTMTEYASPWRFPPLKPLSEDMVSKQPDAPRPMATAKEPQKESKPLARELKRLTRTK